MARRRNTETDLERDDDIIASLSVPVSPAPLLTPGLISPEGFFNEIEDRRSYHPDGVFRSLLDTRGLVAGYRAQPRSTARGYRAPKLSDHQPTFDAPKAALVCVRRKTRREVIFAKKKHRRGAGARRRRRNYYSNVRC